ncbi:GNAT family N-acetyltransferase [Salmonella enterica]|nr:GNAT family N-acetyltransferase [Salmonella enterica]
MSSVTYMTYLVKEIPLVFHTTLLALARALIDYEQTLTLDILGRGREGVAAKSIRDFFIEDSVVVIAFDEDTQEPVGFCSYWADPVQGRLIIDTVYVSPDYRQQGIAKHMLTQPLSMGFSLIDIHALVNNPAAIKLYESLGFKPYITTMTKVN